MMISREGFCERWGSKRMTTAFDLTSTFRGHVAVQIELYILLFASCKAIIQIE
jgi:hypothetical protein